MSIFALDDRLIFPPAEYADDSGLLAAGGDLSARRLLLAYSSGIFPWFSAGDPVLWWSPEPRCIITPDSLRVSRSLSKRLRQSDDVVTFDRDFTAVIDGCASIDGRDSKGGWLTPAMRSAYQTLHAQGYAHSVECWRKGELAGGLYGVALGRCFCGESMFHRQSDASKMAFAALAATLFTTGYALIDCQLPTAHLQSLGGTCVSREHFLQSLRAAGVVPSLIPAAGPFPQGELTARAVTGVLQRWQREGGGAVGGGLDWARE